MKKLISQNEKIYVAGSNGMVGSAICKSLTQRGFDLAKKNLLVTSKKELDLTKGIEVDIWFKKNMPDIVIFAAAKVGGILANNNNPVEFLLENIKIQNNLIESSWKYGVKKFLFLGSSCIYPKFCKQPIKEEYLLSDYLESTNQWYAIAKISGIKLCEAFRKQYNFNSICLMPTNLYGPRDNYNLNDGHVMAALIRKFYDAKINQSNEVICWGTGKPIREFLYVEDFAEACLFALENWEINSLSAPKDSNGMPLEWLNIGSDYEISIYDLSYKIAKIIGYKGKIIWDNSKPDGTPRKKLDNKHINNLGWQAKTDIDYGIRKTLESFKYELESKTIRI